MACAERGEVDPRLSLCADATTIGLGNDDGCRAGAFACTIARVSWLIWQPWACRTLSKEGLLLVLVSSVISVSSSRGSETDRMTI